MVKKSFAEKEYEKAVKVERIANWEDQIAYYKKEIRDICARVGHGDIEIGSEEFVLSMEIVDGDACRIGAYQNLLDSEKKKK